MHKTVVHIVLNIREFKSTLDAFSFWHHNLIILILNKSLLADKTAHATSTT